MKRVMVTKVGKIVDQDESKRAKIEVLDYPIPEPGEREVLIKVAYCAICGSDPHVIEGIFGWEPPFGIGHEISGVIEKVGPGCKTDVKVGDRVAGNFLDFCGACYYCKNGQQQFCENIPEGNFGYSEYVIWNENQVVKLPDNISLKKGCLLEPLSIGIRASDVLNLKVGSRVFINGGGPIGLILLNVLKMQGTSFVTLSEPVEERRQMALEYGADFVINPFEENLKDAADRITGGLGYDAVCDATGSTRAIEPLPALVAKGGTLLFVGQYPNDYCFPLNLSQYCYLNEVTVRGFFVAPYTFPRAAQVLPMVNFDKFMQKVYYIDDAQEALEMHTTSKYPKIMLNCNKDLADL
jgi:(R,R)-butanediol dehydrogenase/meso-butanediol dehydrogenase/diacetyl reductase/L-iditol 2-dehydrogenase